MARSVITTWDGYVAYASRRDRTVRDGLRGALQLAGDQVIDIMRATTAFKDQTGNLRASIGHPGPYPAGVRPPTARPDLGKLVAYHAGVFTLKIPIGMEYASFVDDRTGFTREAAGRAPDIVHRRIEEATAQLGQSLVAA